MKSKKGWIRLVEVFIAILLVTGVLLVVSSRINSYAKTDAFVETSKKEIAILRDIELNNTLRTEILGAPLPTEWANFDSTLPLTRDRIIKLTPSNLECRAKICAVGDNCITEELAGRNIYAESVFIAADLDTYAPRQIKLFCVEREI